MSRINLITYNPDDTILNSAPDYFGTTRDVIQVLIIIMELENAVEFLLNQCFCFYICPRNDCKFVF